MSLIEIRPPRSVEEYHEACAMVERVYRQSGYLRFGQLLEHPLAPILAFKDGRVVGSVGVQSGDQGPLPSEVAFGPEVLQASESPRDRVFEWVRLAITDRADRSVLQGITLATLSYVQRQYEQYSWILTVKPTLARALRMVCRLTVTPLSCLVREDVGELYPGYYFTRPRPSVTRVERQKADAAQAYLIQELKDKVVIDLGSFDHYLDYGSISSYPDSLMFGRFADAIPAGDVWN